MTKMFVMLVMILSKQVYGVSNRLVSFIKDNTDTFLFQDTAEEVGKAQVILLDSDGGGGDVAEPPTGNAGKILCNGFGGC